MSFGGGYVADPNSGSKIGFYDKKLKEEREKYQKMKEDLAKGTEAYGVKQDKFQKRSNVVEEELAKKTVGLVNLKDFREKREDLEKQAKTENATMDGMGTEEEGGKEKSEKKKKKKEKKRLQSSMSFDMGEGEEEEEDCAPKKSKKNPNVDTSMLPDKELDAIKDAERARVQKAIEEKANELKAERQKLVPLPAGHTCIRQIKNEVVEIHINQLPGANLSNKVKAVRAEEVVMDIGARPKDGAANDEMIRFLIDILGLEKGQAVISRGHKAPIKIVEIRANSVDIVHDKLFKAVRDG